MDLAIRLGWLKDSNLRARKLQDAERYVVASADYAKSRRRPHSPKDLEDWEWIELSPVGPSQQFKNAQGKSLSFKPRSQIRVSNASAMLQLVLNGNGVAALPGFLVDRELAGKQLVRVLPTWNVKPIGIYAVWPSNARKNGLTSQLVRHLVNANV